MFSENEKRTVQVLPFVRTTKAVVLRVAKDLHSKYEVRECLRCKTVLPAPDAERQ